jgi:hypothetical protein
MVRFPPGASYFSLLQNVGFALGHNQTPSQRVLGDSFSGDDATQVPSFSVEVKNECVYIHSFLCFQGVHRDKLNL